MDIFTILIWLVTLIFLGVSFVKDKEKQNKPLKYLLQWVKECCKYLNNYICRWINYDYSSACRYRDFRRKTTCLSSYNSCINFWFYNLNTSIHRLSNSRNTSWRRRRSCAIGNFLNHLNYGRFCDLPLERKEFGTKFTLVRNGLSFVFLYFDPLDGGNNMTILKKN